MLRVANKARLDAAGMVSHQHRAVATSNSAGLFAYHPSTSVSLSMTCRTRDGTGSGWGAAMGHQLGGIDPAAVAARAAEKAELSQDPEAIEPGAYTVILEPQAVAELLQFLGWSLDRRSADEGRSAFAKPGGGTKIGEALFHPSITLRSDPSAAEHPSSPFAGDGEALPKTTWIDKGVLKSLATSRYWAKTSGTATVPRPSSFILEGTSKTGGQDLEVGEEPPLQREPVDDAQERPRAGDPEAGPPRRPGGRRADDGGQRVRVFEPERRCLSPSSPSMPPLSCGLRGGEG
jgi:predicted Zn-dependent protease